MPLGFPALDLDATRPDEIPSNLASEGPGPDLKSQILKAFAAKASQSGITAVAVAQLASEMGISTKTLYRHYRSKDDLVGDLIDAWVYLVIAKQEEQLKAIDDPVERIKSSAVLLYRARKSMCAQFWEDLETTYPHHAIRLDVAIKTTRNRAATLMRPRLRDDLQARLIGKVLQHGLEWALSEGFSYVTDLDPEEIIRQYIEIWANGALKNETEGQQFS